MQDNYLKGRKVTSEKNEFYLSTPDGDVILAEIFQENRCVTLLIGGDYRIDLDTASAFELADSLLLIANESEFSH